MGTALHYCRADVGNPAAGHLPATRRAGVRLGQFYRGGADLVHGFPDDGIGGFHQSQAHPRTAQGHGDHPGGQLAAQTLHHGRIGRLVF